MSEELASILKSIKDRMDRIEDNIKDNVQTKIDSLQRTIRNNDPFPELPDPESPEHCVIWKTPEYRRLLELESKENMGDAIFYYSRIIWVKGNFRRIFIKLTNKRLAVILISFLALVKSDLVDLAIQWLMGYS